MISRIASLGVCAFLLAGCAKNNAPAKQYSMHGKIVSMDSDSHVVKISAGQIGDWMGPMTMDYPVPDKTDWQKLKAGEIVDANVFVRGDEYWVAGVKPASK